MRPRGCYVPILGCPGFANLTLVCAKYLQSGANDLIFTFGTLFCYRFRFVGGRLSPLIDRGLDG